MSDYVTVVALVEGQTEKIFVQEVVAPWLSGKGVYITPIIISKPGQKGGDVKFARVKNDVELHLKQRQDTYLTLFVDYYGLRNDWPGFEEAKQQRTPCSIAEKINSATKDSVNKLFKTHGSDRRFIPYVAMYEFEAMLFSEPQILATHLQVKQSKVDKIISDCGAPECIDDSPQTAPSKRIKNLSARFKKTTTGIAIAKAIGLVKIREQCPIFSKWLMEIEHIKEARHGKT